MGHAAEAERYQLGEELAGLSIAQTEAGLARFWRSAVASCPRP
jgi:hypothetical protein